MQRVTGAKPVVTTIGTLHSGSAAVFETAGHGSIPCVPATFIGVSYISSTAVSETVRDGATPSTPATFTFNS